VIYKKALAAKIVCLLDVDASTFFPTIPSKLQTLSVEADR